MSRTLPALGALLLASRALATAPTLLVGAPPGLLSGSTVTLSARLTRGDRGVLSWSLSLGADGLTYLDATASGTAFDRLSQGGYAEAGVRPDGGACYSIGVLSFTQPVVLPPGTHELLKMRCLVSRRDPGTVTVVPRDGLTLPDDDRVFRNEVLLEGGEVQPIAVATGRFAITGCAGIVLAAGELPPGQSPATIEARRGTEVTARALVRVLSIEHLDPAGFSFGVAHDPAVLELAGTSLDPGLLSSYVRADGFARIEHTANGYIVAALSSASDPASLGVGDHLVATATYRFAAHGDPGDEIATALGLSDGLESGGAPVPSVFQPRDARPCEMSRLPLAFVIGPHWWLRGDANADGKADLADAIVALQHLFLGAPIECERAAEINLDGHIDISDPISLLAHLFLGAPPLAPPFPDCGTAEEALPCGKFPCPAT